MAVARAVAASVVALILMVSSDAQQARGTKVAQLSESPAVARLTEEQRIQLKTALSGENVRPVTDVNVTLAVGAVLPGALLLHRLPEAAREAAPGYRGFRFVLINGKFCVVDPATSNIVDVLD